MKKILAFALALLVLLSMFVFAGCNEEEGPKNINAGLENFDSYVSADSEIIGVWDETSTTDEYVWTFFEYTTLHITKTTSGISYSTVCAYNYNDETGELQYYVMTEDVTHSYTVTIDGANMEMVSEDGNTVRTFEKIS